MKSLYKLSNEELFAISMEKQTRRPQKGCATRRALEAQWILHERAGCPFGGKPSWKKLIEEED